MSIKSFTKTESVAASGGHFGLQILKNNSLDLNQIKPGITGENSNRSVSSVLQPFKVFKPIPGDGFGKMETKFLIDYIIKTHHDFAKKNAVIIYVLSQKVFYRHRNTHPELLTINNIIFLFLHDLLNQMKGEEQFLFPRIRQAANDVKFAEINDTKILQSLKRKRKLLQNNHAQAFTYLNTLRQVTNNYKIPADACPSYKTLFEKIKALEDDLIIHFHLEDDFLFPKGLLIRDD